MTENARTGFYPVAGHISIQEYDPTTDLSFRNLRIAPQDLPPEMSFSFLSLGRYVSL
jgi:hypothetical protein